MVDLVQPDADKVSAVFVVSVEDQLALPAWTLDLEAFCCRHGCLGDLCGKDRPKPPRRRKAGGSDSSRWSLS